MSRVTQQTREEKIAMYMKLTKWELVEMLVSANDAASTHPSPVWTGPTTWNDAPFTVGKWD